MKKSVSSTSLLIFFLLSLLCLFSLLGFCIEQEEEADFTIVEMATLGGIRNVPDQNSVENEELARFAVEQHNKKTNALLEFGRLVKAKEQVVAGTMYHLTLEAIDAGKKKIYEAKVWVKPWMSFKELQEFKPAEDSSSTPSGANA